MRRMNRLSKYMLCLGMLSLVACAADGVGPEQSGGSSEHVDYMSGPNGETVGLVKPGQLEAYRAEMSEAYPEQQSLDHPGMSGDAAAGASGAEGDAIEKAGCWVWLDWCVDPSHGGFTCHDNGHCTVQRFLQACFSLYNDICI